MGIYTELHFNARLKEISPEILMTLKYMIGEIDTPPLILPDHKLFTNDTRWRYMLQTDSSSFDADTHSTLKFNLIDNSLYLCIRSNFKNYNNEIPLFLEWIMPYLDKIQGDFLGFFRHEKCDIPILIFMKEGNK